MSKMDLVRKAHEAGARPDSKRAAKRAKSRSGGTESKETLRLRAIRPHPGVFRVLNEPHVFAEGTKHPLSGMKIHNRRQARAIGLPRRPGQRTALAD